MPSGFVLIDHNIPPERDITNTNRIPIIVIFSLNSYLSPLYFYLPPFCFVHLVYFFSFSFGCPEPSHHNCYNHAMLCFGYKCYRECEEWCVHIEKCSAIGELVLKAKLLRGKCFYYMYQKELFNLMDKSFFLGGFSQEKYKFFYSCYMEKAFTAIQLLGSVYDANCIDEEGKKLLDFALMGYCNAANDGQIPLRKHQRCMLCLKRRSLANSHIWPKFLLKKMVEAYQLCSNLKFTIESHEFEVELEHPEKLKIYHSKEGFKGHVPKEISVPLLCGACEELICQNGEVVFSRTFTTPLILSSDGAIATASTSKYEQSLMQGKPLGEHLYNFCVSIVFRCFGLMNLHFEMNFDEGYKLFLACRKHLLSLPFRVRESVVRQNCSTESSYDVIACKSNWNLKFHLFINPTSLHNVEDIRSLWLQGTLTSIFSASLINKQLESERHYDGVNEAHFCAIRLGLFLIIYEFQPSEKVMLPQETLVNPCATTFIIPPEERRWKYIPKGIAMMYANDAYSREKNYSESLLGMNEDVSYIKKKQLKGSGLGEQINESKLTAVGERNTEKVASESENLATSVFLNKSSAMLNYLPKEYEITSLRKYYVDYRSEQFMQPPAGHYIIQHITSSNTTLFLVADSTDLAFIKLIAVLVTRGDITKWDGVNLELQNDVLCITKFLQQSVFADLIKQRHREFPAFCNLVLEYLELLFLRCGSLQVLLHGLQLLRQVITVWYYLCTALFTFTSNQFLICTAQKSGPVMTQDALQMAVGTAKISALSA